MGTNDLMVKIEHKPGKEPVITLMPGTGLQWMAQKHSVQGYLGALKALGVYIGDIKIQKKNANGINNVIIDGLKIRVVREMFRRWPKAFNEDGKEPSKIFDPLYAHYDMQLSQAMGGTLRNLARINDPQYWLLNLDPTDYHYYYLDWSNHGWSFHKSAEDAKKFIATVPRSITTDIYDKQTELVMRPERYWAYQTKTCAVRKYWVDRSKLGCLWCLGQRDDDTPLFYEEV